MPAKGPGDKGGFCRETCMALAQTADSDWLCRVGIERPLDGQLELFLRLDEPAPRALVASAHPSGTSEADCAENTRGAEEVTEACIT
ncbi:uncharacterized protein TrAFT101_009167 [Trichoderma asperellum]|uniref:uncharacterized protein n=1 Tax=Trichoderma asperellum TaxID=101201 RepID=UPI003317E59D|nr:hypothetical protein TrAFT101_009167 [Trichoderma asperellum]